MRRNGGGYLSLWVLGSEIRRRLGNRGTGPPSRSENWTVRTLRGMLPIPPGVKRTSADDDGEAAEPDDERFEVRGEREEEGRGDAEAGQRNGRVEPRGRRDPTKGIARHASPISWSRDSLDSLVGLQHARLDVPFRLRVEPLEEVRLQAGGHLDDATPGPGRSPFLLQDRPQSFAVPVRPRAVLSAQL